MDIINTRKMEVENIPVLLWGKPSDKMYIFLSHLLLTWNI